MEEKKEEKKKTTRKTAKSEIKPAAKKTVAKKPAAKKTTTTKTTTVKAEPKKTSKAAEKKTTVKKAEVTKPAAKTTKATTKKVTAKRTTAKAEPKKVTDTKEEVKTAYKKVETKKSNAKKVEESIIKKEVIKSKIDDAAAIIDKEVIVNKSKSIFDIIFGVYKKPYEFCKDFCKNGDYKNSFILLAIIAVTMGLLITALTFAAFHVQVGGLGSASDFYDIPYFKVFIIWTIVSFIMAFLPIFISYIACNIFSKSKFDFDNSLNLYASTLSSVIIVNFISSIFIFAGLFIKFFLLLSILALIFSFINYIFIYRDMVSFEKEKESYVFLGIFLVWIIGIILICSIFASGIDGLDIYDTIVTTLDK